MSIQLNVRTSDALMKEFDKEVKKGKYKNRSEAVNAAMQEFVRRRRLLEAEKKMHEIAKANAGLPSLTKALLEAREEEDNRF